MTYNGSYAIKPKQLTNQNISENRRGICLKLASKLESYFKDSKTISMMNLHIQILPLIFQ